MGTFRFNGIEYTGNDFEIKERVLYIDGHAVADMKPNSEELIVSGEGTIISDTKVVIYGKFIGDITAQKVIINGEFEGNMNVQHLTDNRS